MYQLAQPRCEGPLRRRWRNRTTLRSLSLTELWQWRVARHDAPPNDLPDLIQGAVLRQDLDWVLGAADGRNLAPVQELRLADDPDGFGARALAGLEVGDPGRGGRDL